MNSEGTEIFLDNRRIGGGSPAFIIAEIAQAHDGSLGMAHAYVDAAADAGADAVKFQTHIAAAESTFDEPFRIAFSRQDAKRFDYWRRMEFTAEQWAGLSAHAAERNLVFLSSAFSIEAVRLLAAIGMPAWKIASGELASLTIIDEMTKAGGPFLVSTGMSGWSEITKVVEAIRSRGRGLALFQCTSRYPTALEEVGLNVIDELRQRFHCPVGLSDHSGTVFPALAAIARGADIVELHLTLSRDMFGPDVSASLTKAELAQVVAARHAFAVMDRCPVDKAAAAERMTDMRLLFKRSVAPVRDLPEGTVLAAEMLAAKKPGSGIPFESAGELVGRRLARAVTATRLLTWEDLS